jgi:hypothetical protein
MQVDLDVGLCKQNTGKTVDIKGYFYALVAESSEYVDVPFEPNESWIRVTPDLEVQIIEAQCTGSSYRLKVETRPQRGSSMRPLCAEDSLPRRIALGRQLIGANGELIQNFSGPRHVPAPLGGSSSGSGSRYKQIEKIRFVLAINPAHKKIPFELEKVPLP